MTAPVPLRLRLATAEDAQVLWAWANDPETRAAAWDRPIIPWEEHIAWLARTLPAQTARTWMAVAESDREVGSIRFDTLDGWNHARLSYVVAPGDRGKGFGTIIVEAGVRELLAEKPSTVVMADVRASNIASLRIFRRMGWKESTPDAGRLRFTRGPDVAPAA